ncbi:MAG: M24 family metallopeptidase, partial [Fidelibacterota bacterium]
MAWEEKRVENLRERLREHSLDGLLVTNLTNVHYLSGFTGSSGTCLILSHEAFFISDGRYLTQSSQEVRGMETIIGAEPHLEIIQKNGLVKEGLSIGFEADHTPVSLMEKMTALFPECRWESTSHMVEEIAAVKDQEEIRLIRKAVEITDEVFDQIVPELRPGVEEREIAARISYIIRMHEADGNAFSPIVASGPNSALPHAVPGP